MKFSRNVPVVLSLILLAAVLTTCLSPFASVKEQGDFVITIGADINSRAVTDYPPKGITGITGGTDAPDIADLRFSVTFTASAYGTSKTFEKQGSLNITGSLDQGNYTVRANVFLGDGTLYAQGYAIDNPVHITGGATNQVTVWVYSVNDAQMPFISAGPQDATCVVGYQTAYLYVSASVTDGGTLTYQWYSNTTASNSGGTKITGLNTNSYMPPTATVGTVYYYVVVTNTNNDVPGSKTATAVSNAAAVTVTAIPASDWTAAANPFGSGCINSIAYGGGKFVVWGWDENWDVKAAYSADGVAWTVAATDIFDTIDSTIDILPIAYGNGKFVASGDRKMAYSADGITWTAIAKFNNSQIRSIAYGETSPGVGRFIAIGYDYTAYGYQIAYSADGVAWTDMANPFGTANIYSIAYGGGKFIVGGGDSSTGYRTAYSADGASWTVVTGFAAGYTVYGGDRFLARDSGSGGWAYSTDCMTWTAVPNPPLYSIASISIAYGNGKFVAIDGSGGGRMAYSSDAIAWKAATSPFGASDILQGIVYGGGKFFTWSLNDDYESKMAYLDK